VRLNSNISGKVWPYEEEGYIFLPVHATQKKIVKWAREVRGEYILRKDGTSRIFLKAHQRAGVYYVM